MNSLHKCAVSVCEEQISLRHLMCPRHWHLVPAALQTEVYRTLKAGPVKNYHEARDAAVAAVQHIIRPLETK